ncbi:MAG: pilus assembly protein, partial [Haloferacaceae archaeon]
MSDGRGLGGALALLAALAPRTPDPDDDLRRAVAYLGLDASAATVARASRGGALPAAVLVGGAAAR